MNLEIEFLSWFIGFVMGCFVMWQFKSKKTIKDMAIDAYKAEHGVKNAPPGYHDAIKPPPTSPPPSIQK